MDVERRKRTRVLEHNASAAHEIEHGASKARQRIVTVAYDPIAIQSKVNVNDSSIVEVDKLVLAAPFHRLHTRAMQCAQRSSGQSTTNGGMERLYALDDVVLNCSAQVTDGAFDFGKLGHAALCNRWCC